MATLHMDVEQVQAAQQKMVSEREALLNELGTLTNQINSIIGSAWQGNSATEFQQAYEQLRNQLNQQLTALGELATAMHAALASINADTTLLAALARRVVDRDH